VAVLIDEYDAPVTNLVDKPNRANKVRRTLCEYYTILKSLEEYISFLFVTGITKFVQGGLYSAFNNLTDISFDPEYGALTGFTHEEIVLYFDHHIDVVAEKQKMSRRTLLENMKEYYNGFCFDAETMVYNPYSTLLFFQHKDFANYWFNT
jgi:hypothetical protein